MDDKDRKILYELSENARESHNVLARKLKISREVLDYRIKKLEKEGIIYSYQARINISNFIYGGYILLIKCSGLKESQEKLIINKIKNDEHTQYLGRVGGGYDLIIGFTVKDLADLGEYISFINNSFSVYKQRVTFLTMIREFKDSIKGVFLDNEEVNKINSMPIIEEKVLIDNIDEKIISILGKGSSTYSWEIAEKVKISDVAVRKRIGKLIERKVILGFRTMIDLTKLGYEVVFLFLKVNFKDKIHEKELENFFVSNNKITYATKIIGEYDYVLTTIVKNNLDLNNFIKNLREKLSNSIIEVESMPLFEMVYHTQLARSFLK